MIRTAFVIVSLFAITTFSNAQENGSVFYHLTRQNGLSSDNVIDCTQDKEGFYWIATIDGLNRFNGTTCTVFRNNKSDSFSISNNYCTAVIEDDEENIWVATLQGVNRYSKKENRFERFYFTHPFYSFDLTNAITSLAKDENGNIWVASFGLWKYDRITNKWTAFQHDPDDSASIPPGNISHLQYDKKNKRLWMLNNIGSIYFDLRKKKFYHKHHNPAKNKFLELVSHAIPYIVDEQGGAWFFSNSLKKIGYYSFASDRVHYLPYRVKNDILNLKTDPEGKIWINYWWSPTVIYDPMKKKLMSGFLDYYHPRSALSNNCRNLFIDRKNNYWICSEKGISIFNRAAQSVRYYTLFENRKSADAGDFTISCLAEQHGNILWVGSNEGLFKYDLNNNHFKQIRLPLPVPNTIRCITMNTDSVLWISGNHSLILFDIHKEKIIKQIKGLDNPQFIIPKKDSVLIGLWNDGMYFFSKDGKKLSHLLPGKNPALLYHKSLLSFGKENTGSSEVWLGYNGGKGFSKLNLADHTSEHFMITTNGSFVESSNTITVLTEDDDKNLWLGTYGNGIFHFNRKNNSFQSFTQSDGLKGNFINSILRDDNCHLWISTNNGLSILDTRTNHISNTEIDLRFANRDFVANALKRKNGNYLFFSGSKIVEITPAAFLQKSDTSKILISSFSVFNKPSHYVALNKPNSFIKLVHKENFFSFEYSLLKADPNNIIHYAYQLEGFDKSWNDVLERRVAYYTNVPPGKYIFKVKAADATGEWRYFSEPVAITIITPFYATWWFISLVLLTIISGVFMIYRFRIRQLKKVIAVRTKISQDLHDDMASTLSGIKLYTELAKTQLSAGNKHKANESLDIISSHASETKQKMSDIIWAVNPANDNLEVLLKKLKSYANELILAKGMTLIMEADENIYKEKLSMPQRRNIYLICKEAINNAVKYSGGNHLELFFGKQDHFIYLKVNDNGKGFDPSVKYEGNGLLNMKKRAEEINARLIVDSAPKKGTQITVVVKL